MLAGRDLQAGGTWFGLARDRRFGLVTNFREPARPQPGAPTRGHLLTGYLQTPRAPGQFLEQIADDASGYAGFNLLLADAATLWYASNRAETFCRPLPAGIYTLSNHLLDTPWPKVQRLRHALERWLAAATDERSAFDERSAADERSALWEALSDRQRAEPHQLPATGVTPEWEHLLSAPFVRHPDYGTRCSSLLLVGHDNRVVFEERSFDAAGAATQHARYTLPGTRWLES